MFASERMQKIRQILFEYKKADVSKLSEILSVSEVTIRKDLERLEEENFLTRTHGGAILSENASAENSYNIMPIPEIDHKKTIGIIGAQMINNNEAIFIGSGTTCLQLARNLKDKKNVTVITNNVSVAVELSNISTLKVILTGGNIKNDEYTQSVYGPSTIRAIQDIYVDKAFIGVNGISFKRGYTIHDEDYLNISNEISKYTNELIVLADNTKFNKIALSQLGDITLAQKVISDELVPEEYLKFYFENDIQIFTTYKFS